MQPHTGKPTVVLAPVHIMPAALDPEAAARFVSLSRRTFDGEMKAQGAPKPRKLAGRRVGYLVSELLAWLESRPVSDNLPPENSGYGRAGKPA